MEEERLNKSFEENNKEFCKTFADDMESRNKALADKNKLSIKTRSKGNDYFKLNKFDEAREEYLQALKLTPFDTKILLNIAQVYIKTKEFTKALEFLSRVLYFTPDNAKVLCLLYANSKC